MSHRHAINWTLLLDALSPPCRRCCYMVITSTTITHPTEPLERVFSSRLSVSLILLSEYRPMGELNCLCTSAWAIVWNEWGKRTIYGFVLSKSHLITSLESWGWRPQLFLAQSEQPPLLQLITCLPVITTSLQLHYGSSCGEEEKKRKTKKN